MFTEDQGNWTALLPACAILQWFQKPEPWFQLVMPTEHNLKQYLLNTIERPTQLVQLVRKQLVQPVGSNWFSPIGFSWVLQPNWYTELEILQLLTLFFLLRYCWNQTQHPIKFRLWASLQHCSQVNLVRTISIFYQVNSRLYFYKNRGAL